jgi:AraC family transcriptional regulator, arabinose operon regulatory protein
MATALPEAAALERPDGRPDVLLVRRISRTGSVHGEGTKHWTLVYTLSGQRRFRVRGAEFVVEPDSVVVYRRDNIPSWIQEPPMRRWSNLAACFDPGAPWSPPRGFERVDDGIYRTRVTYAGTRERIRDAFGRLFADSQARMAARAVRSLTSGAAGDPGMADDEARRELMLMTLREVLLLASDEMKGTAKLDLRIRAALELMASDLTAGHTLASLGRMCDLSPSRFAHLFRAELGISPVRALRLMRLRQAALQLQHTDDTVERIAEATGFTSISHLSHEFRRHFGVSPRRYRAQAFF